MPKHQVGEVYKDNWESKYPWRCMAPWGPMPFVTKRDAMEAAKMVHKIKLVEKGKRVR